MPKKPISLRDVTDKQSLEKFQKEHPSTGDADKFDALLGRMAGVPKAGPDAPKKPGKK